MQDFRSTKIVLAAVLLGISLSAHGFIDRIANICQQAGGAISNQFRDCTGKDYALIATAGAYAITGCILWNKNRLLKNAYTKRSQELTDHQKKYADQDLLNVIDVIVAAPLRSLYKEPCQILDNPTNNTQKLDSFTTWFRNSQTRGLAPSLADIQTHATTLAKYQQTLKEKLKLWHEKSEKGLLTYQAEKLLKDVTHLMACTAFLEQSYSYITIAAEHESVLAPYEREIFILSTGYSITTKLTTLHQALLSKVCDGTFEQTLEAISTYHENIGKALSAITLLNATLKEKLVEWSKNAEQQPLLEPGKQLKEKIISHLTILEMVQSHIPFVRLLALKKEEESRNFQLEKNAVKKMHNDEATVGVLDALIRHSEGGNFYPYGRYLDWLKHWGAIYQDVLAPLTNFETADMSYKQIIGQAEETNQAFKTLIEIVSNSTQLKAERRERAKDAQLAQNRARIQQLESNVSKLNHQYTALQGSYSSLQANYLNTQRILNAQQFVNHNQPRYPARPQPVPYQPHHHANPQPVPQQQQQH